MAASSRFSADVMGRPLSSRIFLASRTLVPVGHKESVVTLTGDEEHDKNGP